MTSPKMNPKIRKLVNQLKAELIAEREKNPIVDEWNEKDVVYITRDICGELLKAVNADGMCGCPLCQG